MARLAGKIALITGTASGIGREAAILFAREGARVAAVDIDVAGGEETVRRAAAGGARDARFIRADVTDPESMQAAVRETVATFGPLTVLYNNAGGSTMQDGPAPGVSLDEFWRAIKLDLFGTFLGCRFGIPEIVKAGGGAVVNTASVVALMGFPGRDAYTAAKGGVAAITRSLAVQYGRDKVRVNAVAPGVTRTPRVEALLAGTPALAQTEAQHLLGLCEPADVAQAAVYLASDESARTTGHILAVDSGLLIT